MIWLRFGQACRQRNSARKSTIGSGLAGELGNSNLAPADSNCAREVQHHKTTAISLSWLARQTGFRDHCMDPENDQIAWLLIRIALAKLLGLRVKPILRV